MLLGFCLLLCLFIESFLLIDFTFVHIFCIYFVNAYICKTAHLLNKESYFEMVIAVFVESLCSKCIGV